MIINGRLLLEAAPIVDMLEYKVSGLGPTSYGLSEAGYDIRIKQQIVFNRVSPKFQIASAIEEFNMPPNLVGIVHDKSSWARQGLSVFNTVIEPGWRGFLTLELVYHGPRVLIIPAGSGIAQVVFHETAMPASYIGKYQDQADAPVPTIFERD